MLMNLASFSQPGIQQEVNVSFDYCVDSLPLKFVVNGDTLFLITYQQLVISNITYQRSLKYEELLDSLRKAYDNTKLIIATQGEVIASQKNEAKAYDAIVGTQAIIMKNDSIIQKQQDNIIKDNKKAHTGSKIKDGLLYTIIAILTGLNIYGVVK